MTLCWFLLKVTNLPVKLATHLSNQPQKIIANLAHMHILCPFCHDDVIKWKHFPRNLPFVRGIHRSPLNSHHKGQWRGALVFSLICIWINDWVNNREAGNLRRYRAHYDVIVMVLKINMRSAMASHICGLIQNCIGIDSNTSIILIHCLQCVGTSYGVRR